MPEAKCFDCNLPYEDEAFQDLVIPDKDWKLISPSRDQYGLLCPNCILRRLSKLSIKTEGKFKSGPLRDD